MTEYFTLIDILQIWPSFTYLLKHFLTSQLIFHPKYLPALKSDNFHLRVTWCQILNFWSLLLFHINSICYSFFQIRKLRTWNNEFLSQNWFDWWKAWLILKTDTNCWNLQNQPKNHLSIDPWMCHYSSSNLLYHTVHSVHKIYITYDKRWIESSNSLLYIHTHCCTFTFYMYIESCSLFALK